MRQANIPKRLTFNERMDLCIGIHLVLIAQDIARRCSSPMGNSRSAGSTVRLAGSIGENAASSAARSSFGRPLTSDDALRLGGRIVLVRAEGQGLLPLPLPS